MTQLLRPFVPFPLLALWLTSGAPAAGDTGVIYTIPAEEALHGPKSAVPNHVIDPSQREATIAVDAAKVLGRVNPLVFGACFEDLNHQIYGGFYAQMIFGESFEEGPEEELPPGWRLHADWLKIPTWKGMWCAENDSIGMTGFRWYKLLWEGARFGDGVIESELMQPAYAVANTGPTTGTVRAVERMPALPEPLAIRDWAALSRAYYQKIFDSTATGAGWPAVQIDVTPGFRMKSYLGVEPADEAMTCLSAVVGARLAGLDPRAIHGRDWLAACDAWFDPTHGIFRHSRQDRSPIIHADIYGYLPSVLGLMLAAQFPENTGLQAKADAVVATFHTIARGLGCPDRPDFDVLGWDLAAGKPGGREEPMNRLGHAPAVAWILAMGADRGGGNAMRDCARAALQWQLDHPGRYEVTHLMGPLAAARLNVRPGPKLDLGRLLDIWFGDGPIDRHPWGITAGTRCGGITCDGLDGARWQDDGFYAFTMGSLQGPAWLVPVAAYDPRFARAIGRYALHAANSARLLQGHGLDADHEDHPAWKARWDPDDLMFYEGLKSWDPAPGRRFRPYATGDPVLLGWHGRAKPEPARYHQEKQERFAATADNISLYMGNHIGFLGGIVATTEVPGVLLWDCRKTDWFHGPAWPAFLAFNPHPDERVITVETGPEPVAVFDLVSGEELHASVTGRQRVRLPGDTARVLVMHTAKARRESRNGMIFVGDCMIGGS